MITNELEWPAFESPEAEAAAYAEMYASEEAHYAHGVASGQFETFGD